MSHAVRPMLFVIVILTAAALGGAGVGRAQPQTTPQDVLGGILTEVRGLRVAMEHMASAGPRVQLALGRLQLQEQRVTELSMRLSSTKQALAATQQQHDLFERQLKSVDESITREVGADAEKHRREVEEAMRAMKLEGRRVEMEMQRLQAEEASLTQELSVEQGRWSELNQRLEEVERSLDRR